MVNNFKFPNLHSTSSLLCIQQSAHHWLVISSAYIFPSTGLCKANLPFTYGLWAVCGHCIHTACSAAEAAITKTLLTLPARHISKQIYICLWLLCIFFFNSTICVPHVTILSLFSALFFLDHICIVQAKPAFIPTNNLQLLSASSTQCTETWTWEQMYQKHTFSWIPLLLFR